MKPTTARTGAELARALNVTARTVRNWRSYPDFPKQRRGVWDLAEVAAWARRMRSETKDRSFAGGRRVGGSARAAAPTAAPAARARGAAARPAPPPAPPVEELEAFADLGQSGARAADDPRLTRVRLQNVILAHDIKERREAMIPRAELVKMFAARMREWRRHLLTFARAVAPKLVGCTDVKFVEVTIASEVTKLLWLAYGRDRDSEGSALDEGGTDGNTPDQSAAPASPKSEVSDPNRSENGDPDPGAADSSPP